MQKQPMQKKMEHDIKANVSYIKRCTSTSVLVGFGVSDAKQTHHIARISDGVIVGSAIMERIIKTNSVSKTISYIKQLVHAAKRAC